MANFSFDIFKRVEITTYLNLTTDFMPWYNAVAALGEGSNRFTGSVVNGVEDSPRPTDRNFTKCFKGCSSAGCKP